MPFLVLAILFVEHKGVSHPHGPRVLATTALPNQFPTLVPQTVNLTFNSRDGSKQSRITSWVPRRLPHGADHKNASHLAGEEATCNKFRFV